MSSPNSVKPNGLETNKPSSPLKELDNSYDSREAPEDQNAQAVDPTVKKTQKTVKKQPAQSNPEETVKETEGIGKNESVNPEGNQQGEKKKTKKKAKKNQDNGDDQGSDVTASFPKQSAERKGLTENSETNPVETRPSQKETEQEPAGVKSKAKKKKATEVNEDVNQAAEVNQQEKSKKTQKKATETAPKEVQKVAKNEKPKELVSQKAENTKPQSKQASRSTKNIEIAESAPVKSELVNALVSPANLAGKGNAQNKRNLKTAENERYAKNAPTNQDEEVFIPIGKAANLKKSPTQEDLSVTSPKAKKGPIRSKIQTGLGSVRVPSKTADISTVSFAATTRTTKGARSPDNAGQKRAYDITGHRSYADMSGTQKSYVLEKLDTQGETKKKNKKEKQRMRSFDAGKTDKINAADSFETRNRMWQIRKAEKLMEEEKKRSREQNDACTFNPALVNRRAAPLDLSTTSVYDRGLEWTQKVKSAVQVKGDQILEETQKAEPKKPRIKSFNSPPEIRTSKVYIEGFTGPQFGLPKTINVPSYSQEPLKFSGNLEQKISEIHDVYESVSAALKKKSALSSKTGFKEVPKSNYNEVKSGSRISVSSQKERATKVEQVSVTKGDEQRMSALKQMLNLNQKEKKTVVQAETKKPQPEQNPDYFAGKGDDAERIVPKAGQRVEIRNNRYVIVNDEEEF